MRFFEVYICMCLNRSLKNLYIFMYVCMYVCLYVYCLDSQGGQGGTGAQNHHVRVNLTSPLDTFHLMRHQHSVVEQDLLVSDIHTSSSSIVAEKNNNSHSHNHSHNHNHGNKSPLSTRTGAEDDIRPIQRYVCMY